MTEHEQGMPALGFIEEYRIYREDLREREHLISRAINSAWEEFLIDPNEDTYQLTVGSFVARFSSKGQVSAAYRAKPLAKELMAAERMATNGHDLKFLPTRSGYCQKGPDVILDGGDSWDIKRMESRNRNKVFQRLREGAEQACGVVVDVTLGTISVEDAVEMARRAVAADEFGLNAVIVLDPWSHETVITRKDASAPLPGKRPGGLWRH